MINSVCGHSYKQFVQKFSSNEVFGLLDHRETLIEAPNRLLLWFVQFVTGNFGIVLDFCW